MQMIFVFFEGRDTGSESGPGEIHLVKEHMWLQ